MKTIGIIVAMDSELQAFLDCCTSIEKEFIHQKVFYKTMINGHQIVVVLCGIGKVGASFTTTLLVDHFQCDVVINVGTAGGLQSFENILDVVIADTIVQYDMDVYDWGKGFENTKNPTLLVADSYYINLAKQCFKDTEHQCYIGPIATGDTFVNTQQHIDNILTYYPESYCAEMEGGAVAQVCSLMNIPWVVIRSLSDIAIKQDNEMDFETYKNKASQRAALMCMEFINNL